MKLRIFDTRLLVSRDMTGWNVSHWQVPKVLADDVTDEIKVYFADRIAGQSHIFSFDLDHDLQVKPDSLQHRMAPSPNVGTFDDEGVMPARILCTAEERYLFYSGWNSRNTIPYHNATGLARIHDDGSIARAYIGPVMDRSALFPYLSVTPTVWGSTPYHCVYVNGDSWQTDDEGKIEPLYSLRYASSRDLVNWEREVAPLVTWKLHRPCHSNPCYYDGFGTDIILYCDRAPFGYRDNADNGYDISAMSLDLQAKTCEEVGIIWDDSRIAGLNCMMRAYPEVFSWQGGTFVLHNGNNFGATGILISRLGLAE